MAVGDAVPYDEHLRRKDGAGVGKRVEAVLEREGEGGAVAEGFFLREGAVLEAAAGVGCVGHVEDADWLCGKRRVDGEGGIDCVGVEDVDWGWGEVWGEVWRGHGEVGGLVEGPVGADVGAGGEEAGQEVGCFFGDVGEGHAGGVGAGDGVAEGEGGREVAVGEVEDCLAASSFSGWFWWRGGGLSLCRGGSGIAAAVLRPSRPRRLEDWGCLLRTVQARSLASLRVEVYVGLGRIHGEGEGGVRYLFSIQVQGRREVGSLKWRARPC
jgi:hypothetical protein